MAVTRASVVAVAPELGDVDADDPRWDAYLTDAEELVNRNWLGTARADMAVKYLTAHWMTESLEGEASAEGAVQGAIKSVTVGPVTTTYDTSGSSGGAASGEFSGTSYGQRYQRLLKLGGGMGML